MDSNIPWIVRIRIRQTLEMNIAHLTLAAVVAVAAILLRADRVVVVVTAAVEAAVVTRD